MTNIKRMLMAFAAALGLLALAPTVTPAPIVSAAMSSCHKNLTSNPSGAYSWCDSGDSNDRQRVVVGCSNGVTYRGPAKGVFNSSVAACPSGVSRVNSGIEKCDNWVSSSGIWYCASGWYL